MLKAYLKIKCVDCKLVDNDVTTDFYVLDNQWDFLFDVSLAL